MSGFSVGCGEDVAEPGEVDRLVAVPPEQPVRSGAEAHRIPSSSSSSTGSKNEQRADRVEERARARRRAASAAPPGRASGTTSASSAKRRRALAQRLLLVAEDRSREDVEEAVLAGCGRIRVVQAGGRLEDEPALAAAADELRELLDARDAARRRSGSSRARRAPRPRRAARPRDRPRRPVARCRDSTTASARPSSCGNSASCAAGQTRRPSIHACALSRARRSSASASAGGRLAGGNIGAWSKNLVSRARRASSGTRPDATLPRGQAPCSGSLRTASDPGGSSAK